MARNKINNETNNILADNEDNLPIPRVLPSNVQAEQMLLGAILTNNELLNYVSEFYVMNIFLNLFIKKSIRQLRKLLKKG